MTTTMQRPAVAPPAAFTTMGPRPVVRLTVPAFPDVDPGEFRRVLRGKTSTPTAQKQTPAKPAASAPAPPRDPQLEAHLRQVAAFKAQSEMLTAQRELLELKLERVELERVELEKKLARQKRKAQAREHGFASAIKFAAGGMKVFGRKR